MKTIILTALVLVMAGCAKSKEGSTESHWNEAGNICQFHGGVDTIKYGSTMAGKMYGTAVCKDGSYYHYYDVVVMPWADDAGNVTQP